MARRTRKRKSSIIRNIIYNIIHSKNSSKHTRGKRRYVLLKRLGIAAMFFIAVFVCLFVNFKTHELKNQQESYNKVLEDLDENINKEHKRTKSITELRAYVQTKKYAEQVARNKLGLVYPNEILFQADDKNDNKKNNKK